VRLFRSKVFEPDHEAYDRDGGDIERSHTETVY
jgi:hypothetical protein